MSLSDNRGTFTERTVTFNAESFDLCARKNLEYAAGILGAVHGGAPCESAIATIRELLDPNGHYYMD